MPTNGKEILLQVNGRQTSAYLAAPENSIAGVLVLHAWWGLKPFFKQVCDQLAEQGYTALAPDLYQDRIANTIDEAKALMENRDEDFMRAVVKVAHDTLAAQTSHPLGIVGFSMGASWAVHVAANEPDIAAVTMFYGAGDADFKQVRAKVLGHFSDVDEWEPLEWVNKMEAEMKSAGVDVTLHIYPGVAHWFTETDRPEYNADAASLAWERTFEFLKKIL